MGQQNMILLKKRSKGSFFEQIVTNSSGLELFGLLYFFRKKKYNSIEILQNSIQFTFNNVVTYYSEHNDIQEISYNGVKQSLEITEQETLHVLSLKSFEITYEEGKQIHKILANFNEK